MKINYFEHGAFKLIAKLTFSMPIGFDLGQTLQVGQQVSVLCKPPDG
ncbi:MAG: hypothetical protein ABR955_10990 [Verrucomicrobiota bacterium]